MIDEAKPKIYRILRVDFSGISAVSGLSARANDSGSRQGVSGFRRDGIVARAKWDLSPAPVYGLVLPRCESGCCLCFGTVISHPTAEIGRNVYVGIYGCLGDVTLEEDVLLGSHVSIINAAASTASIGSICPSEAARGVPAGHVTAATHGSAIRGRPHRCGPSLRYRAGSVVTKPIPDYAIAVGNPARLIRSATKSSIRARLRRHGEVRHRIADQSRLRIRRFRCEACY